MDVAATAIRRVVDGSRQRSIVTLAALAVAAAVVSAARWGPDWPAQEFRAWTAAHDGLTAWTNSWYSGQPLPGYSVLFPLVSGVVGAGLTGLLAVAAASVAAAGLMPPGGRLVRLGYEFSVVLVLGCDLLIGQIPYLLGVAFGAWAVWAVRSRRPVWAAALAVGTSLSSPLAGAFLLLAVPALAAVVGWRRALPLTAAAAGIGTATVFGGAGGAFPFQAVCLLWIVGFSVICFVVTRDRAVRVLAASYLGAALLLFVVANPVGANLTRFGQLIALPLLWHVLPRLRPLRREAVAALALVAGLWTSWPAISSAGHGATDPSRLATYYTGLLGFLHRQHATAGRVEVVMTREHWESLWVAKEFPIARGWERQTDIAVNGVLYEPLTPQRYHTWLRNHAVSFVALPDAPIDYAGQAEADLLRHPPAYLQPVWHDSHWRVWRVRGASPLASGPATMTALGPASFRLSFAAPGTAVVRIRASQMWTVAEGSGCVGATADGWLRVTATAAGPMTLRARVGTAQLASSPRCT